jgi:oxysterol-binding protein 1
LNALSSKVDAQNNFMGRSFEIHPAGVAHVELLLPMDWALSYPKATGKELEGKVVEHYTWKKVATGTPFIDHSGDVIVRPSVA